MSCWMKNGSDESGKLNWGFKVTVTSSVITSVIVWSTAEMTEALPNNVHPGCEPTTLWSPVQCLSYCSAYSQLTAKMCILCDKMYICRGYTGRDFGSGDPVDVPTQVSLLVKQSTSHESLCQCYIGWYVMLPLRLPESRDWWLLSVCQSCFHSVVLSMSIITQERVKGCRPNMVDMSL